MAAPTDLDRLPALGAGTCLEGGSMAVVERAPLAEPWGGLEAGQDVVVKRLGAGQVADEAAAAALRREGRLGLELAHPDVARTLACVEDPGLGPVLVFEFIPGVTLDELVAAGPVPEPLTRRLGRRVATALAHLHAAGWAHADVKPENLRLDRRGRARLLDLGLVTPLADRGDPPPDHDPGSLAWLPPERLEGAPPTSAADVYALGRVLFNAVTGVAPPPRAPGSPPPRPSSTAPRVTPFLDELVGAALAWDPADRPTAAELAEALAGGESSAWWQARAWSDAPRPAGVSFGAVPLVGRDTELARLAELAAAAFAGAPGATPLHLLGPEGSGKWQLVHEFATHARRGPRPPLFLAGRMTAMREARPYGTILGLLHAWLGLGSGQRPGPEHLAALAELLPPRGAATLEGVLDPAHEGAIEGSVSTALVDWLLALGAERPLIVLLDELQEAGRETRALLGKLGAALAERREAALPFVVLGERDDLADEPDAARAAVVPVTLTLGPLDGAAVEELVRRRFDSGSPRLALARVLMDRSRGNPGLLEELLIGLEASGAAERRSDGRLHLVVAPDSLPMPGSLRQSIAERFRRLDPGQRALLAHMATLAGRLDSAILRRAFPSLANVDLTSALASLARQGWLEAQGAWFRFARPALREAVLGALAPQVVRRLHREAARGLAPRPGERASVGGAIRRAWHLREADLPRELLATLRPVIRLLLERGQPQRTATLTDWGLAAVDTLEREAAADGGELEPDLRDLRLTLLELAAASAGRMGRRADERAHLDRLAELGLDSDDSRTARIYLLHARHARGTSSYGLALGTLKNALDFARRAGRPRLEIESLVLLALTEADAGLLDRARAHAEEAHELAAGRPVDDPDDLASTHLALARVAVLSGRPDRALAQVDRALALGRRHRPGLQARLKAASHLMRARTWRDLGRPARARGSAAKALEIAQHAHERVLEVEAMARLGGLLVDAGLTEEAEARLREALRLAAEIEDHRGKTLARLYLGTLIAEEHDGEGADELARAAADAHDLGLWRTEAMALAIEARVHLLRAGVMGRDVRGSGSTVALPDADELAAAERCSARALTLLERHGAELRDGIVITGTRAMVLHHADGGDLAQPLVRTLRRTMRAANQAIEDVPTRRMHRQATTALLEQVLSPEGPLFPRG